MGGKTSTSRILQGSVGWEMLWFGAPIALGMGLQTTFNLVDAYLISRLGHDVAGPSLGALGIADQIAGIGTILSYGITTASTAMVAQAFGRSDHARVRRIVGQSLIVIAALSVVFGLGAVVFAGFIMRSVVGAKGAVAELGTAYLRVSAGGVFTMFFLLQLTGIQRALGSSKTPIALLLLSNALNLVFAVLLVYGAGPAPPVFAWGPPIAKVLHLPRLELVGAAWSTIVARLLVLIPTSLILASKYDVFERVRFDRATWHGMRAILRVAWPSSMQLVVRMVAMLLTQALVARAFTSHTDQSATTALGIVFKLETMALFIAMGWGSAAQTFVGQNLGAHHPARATLSGWSATASVALVMLALALGYRAWAEPIVRFFDADPAVVRVAVGYLHTVSLGYIGLGVGIVLSNAMAGAGATHTALWTDVAVVLLFQAPACTLAVVLPEASPARLWDALAASYVASGVAFALVFRFIDWIEAGRSRLPTVP
jgi:putative MATE family efflux protein